MLGVWAQIDETGSMVGVWPTPMRTDPMVGVWAQVGEDGSNDPVVGVWAQVGEGRIQWWVSGLRSVRTDPVVVPVPTPMRTDPMVGIWAPVGEKVAERMTHEFGVDGTADMGLRQEGQWERMGNHRGGQQVVLIDPAPGLQPLRGEGRRLVAEIIQERERKAQALELDGKVFHDIMRNVSPASGLGNSQWRWGYGGDWRVRLLEVRNPRALQEVRRMACTMGTGMMGKD
ncbi:hypothetical protein CYMTET_48933 [Cymbomonas tetramitiformis]|uniref:Uncharacterized protein n=1 Tax=Cymbomonas tetramitiformis TaxID=36881 RepID=A0AAE0BR65_9CHLO|nr:hypothetical protein CYMTET_48933 [Cymbomonas tetramitiformis]